MAFALATVARPHLSRSEADEIYVTIGIGDTFDALDALINVISRLSIPIQVDLVDAVSAWLDTYLGHDFEPRLRHVLFGIKVAHAHSPSPLDRVSDAHPAKSETDDQRES